MLGEIMLMEGLKADPRPSPHIAVLPARRRRTTIIQGRKPCRIYALDVEAWLEQLYQADDKQPA